jgi:hypothetical protein
LSLDFFGLFLQDGNLVLNIDQVGHGIK